MNPLILKLHLGGDAEPDGHERRRHYRLRYPEGLRPTLVTPERTYLVTELAQGGLRISRERGGAPPLALGSPIAGELWLPSGRQEVRGDILRRHNDEVVLRLSTDLSLPCVLSEQRRVLRHLRQRRDRPGRLGRLWRWIAKGEDDTPPHPDTPLSEACPMVMSSLRPAAACDPCSGPGHGALDEGDAVTLGETLGARVSAHFAREDYVPPMLPQAIIEVSRLCQRGDVAITDIVAVLERDAMLAGRVLQLAGSAFFGMKVPPTSLRDATVRLGLNALRNLSLQIALEARVFRAPGYDAAMKHLRQHSVATARAARLIARRTAFDAEHAYLLGLFHDIGVAGIIIALADAGQPTTTPSPAELWPTVAEVHAEAGARMIGAWDLPPQLRWEVGLHHHLHVQGVANPSAALLHLAHHLLEPHGFGTGMSGDGEAERDAPEALDAAVYALRLDRKTLRLVALEVEEAVGDLDA